MNRRSFVKTGALAAFGLSGVACAPAGAGRISRPRVNLAPVEASWERVIRTTVGLRPYRPSGFYLAAEKLDAKTVVHNYGHGGAGHSLGWGTGALAADMALEHASRRVAVIGCGTVGLTAARQLQRRGFAVTIYTESVPPNTTSNMALAGFTPTSGLIDAERRTGAWDAQFRAAVATSYEQLQLLVGRGYGVSWIHNYRAVDEPPTPREVSPTALRSAALRTGAVLLQPGEHPFPSRYALRTPSMRIEPAVYLDALVRDVFAHGGRIVVRRFDERRDLSSVSEEVIVNCTGLGARELFADDELTPVKGQLTMLVPQPEVSYATSGGAPGGARRVGFVHMMPRRDGIALGGTSQRGVESLEPDEDARRRIVDTHIELFGRMRRPDPARPLSDSGRAPGGDGGEAQGVPDAIPDVETFFELES